MASRHVDVNERRLRPVYGECLLNFSFILRCLQCNFISCIFFVWQMRLTT